MAKSTPLFVGLDVHKDSIAVAHAQGQSADPPVFRRRDRHAAGGPRQVDPAACRQRRRRWCLRTRPARAATASIAT